MNKKLLLSTILSSALLASTAAKATNFDLTYDGNNKFTFDTVISVKSKFKNIFIKLVPYYIHLD